VTNIEGRRHSHTRASGCKGTRASILKYEAFVYLYIQLQRGEFAFLRMRLSDEYILRCSPRGRRLSCARHHRALLIRDASRR